MDPRKPSRDDKPSSRQDPVAVSEEEHVVAVRVPAEKSQETLIQEACEREEERYETFRCRMMDTERRKR
jgi:hypothetical protein